MTGVSQDDDAVTVDVRGPDGPYRTRTRYLVGCDGARSRIDDRPADALLICPDGHVAWAAGLDESTDSAISPLREALRMVQNAVKQRR